MANYIRVLIVMALSWHMCSSTHECNRTIVNETMTFACPTVSNQLLQLYDLTSTQLKNVTVFVAKGVTAAPTGPFTSIPPNICMMPNLKTVIFANNRLATVDPTDTVGGCLSNVITLDLSYNMITTFPSYMIYNMRNLKNLYMQRNNLTEVPVNAFYSVSTLNILDFSNNSLTTLELWVLDVQTRVDLSNNQITAITNRYFYSFETNRTIAQRVLLTGNGPTLNFTDAVYAMYDYCEEVTMWYFTVDADLSLPAFTQKMGFLDFGTTQISCSCDQIYFLRVFQDAFGDGVIYPISTATCTNSSQNVTDTKVFSSSCSTPRFDRFSTVDFTRVYPRLCKIQDSEEGVVMNASSVSVPTPTTSFFPHYETADMAPGTCFMTFINFTTMSMRCTNDTSNTESRIPAALFGSTYMSSITRVLFSTTISSLPRFLCGLPSGTIDLSYEAFTTLNDITFPCLDSFRRVSLTFNQLTSVSVASGDFKNLSSLDLSSNRLPLLPYSVLTPTPTSLRYIDLRNNSINYIDLFVHTRKNISILLDNNPINSTNIVNLQNTTLTNVTNSTANVTYSVSVTNSSIIIDDSVALTYGLCNDFQSLRNTLLTLRSISSMTRLDCSCKSINLRNLYTSNNLSILSDFTCLTGTNEETFLALTLALCPNRTNFATGLCYIASSSDGTNLQSSGQNGSDSSRTGLIVGLVVGIVGLLLLIAAIIVAVLLCKRCKRGGGGGAETKRRVSRATVNGRSDADGKAQPATPGARLQSRNARGVKLTPLTATSSGLPSGPVGTVVPNTNTLTSSNFNPTLRGSARGIPLRLEPIRSQASVLPQVPPTTTTFSNAPTLHSTTSLSTNSSMFPPTQVRPSDAPRIIPFQTLNIGGDTRTLREGV